jgi:mannosyl-3-phosphoglycerate phosphatase
MILFTDLDGSLLDHADYSFREAGPALARVKRVGIPLVMVTSKTRREVEALQDEMGLEDVFVVENGGGIFFPPRHHHLAPPDATPAGRHLVLRLGVPYSRIREFLAALPPILAVRGFGDLSAEEVGQASGLPLRRAEMARARESTEPFLPPAEAALVQLRERASCAGLTVVRGGRFPHLMGVGQDKGRAVRRVAAAFREGWGQAARTIGLGDSANDLAMLETVDVPILIPNPWGSPPPLEGSRILRAPFPGAKGWNAAVLDLLDAAGIA